MLGHDGKAQKGIGIGWEGPEGYWDWLRRPGRVGLSQRRSVNCYSKHRYTTFSPGSMKTYTSALAESLSSFSNSDARPPHTWNMTTSSAMANSAQGWSP